MKDYVKCAIITLECPHCHLDNVRELFKVNRYKINFIICEEEDGGCGEKFGYKIERITIKTSRYTLEKVNV